MRVEVEDLNTVKKVLHIEIPEEDVVRELDNAYKALKKKAKVKGFRPGKAPRSVLEGIYKKDVNADVTSKLIQESFFEAIKENEINVIGNPKIDPPELDTKNAYKYDATVEIKPEIEDIDYKGLALKKNMYKISDGEIEGQLHMLQKNLAQRELIKEDRPLGDDDFAVIDYEGFKDGEPFEETGKTENYSLRMGGGQISKDFDEQLKGMKVGEVREIKVQFPEDYFNKNLANLEITYEVKLNEIREEILPEINDEMVKQLGQFQTLDELKEEIRKNLDQGYNKRTEQEMNEQIFEALISKTDFEVPESMVEYELEGILQEAEMSFSQSNISLEQLGLSRESLAEKYRDTAEKQVRRHLILGRIIEQEYMTLADEDLEKGFAEMAETYKQPVEGIKNYYEQNKDNLELFKHTLLEKQAVTLILDAGTIEEVEPETEEDASTG